MDRTSASSSEIPAVPRRAPADERRRGGVRGDSSHCRRASDLVRQCRESAGLDRSAFAERLGVPEQIVALWEDPTYEGVDLAIMRRVARAAGGELELRFRPNS